jgi:hypothetical protein
MPAAMARPHRFGWRACVVMALALNLAPVSAARQMDSREVKGQTTVCLYDYAGLPPEMLHKSQVEVSRIFHHAGIDLRWLQGRRHPIDSVPLVPCGDVAGFSGLVLKLIPEQMTSSFHAVPNELGFAVGTQAWVFIGHVRTASEFHDFFVILGHVMAHELGHLLLGPGHSPSGIMCPSYRRETLRNAEFGRLLFTPEQARRMRAKLTVELVSKPSGSTGLRSSLRQTPPDPQYAPSLPDSSQVLSPSSGRLRADR